METMKIETNKKVRNSSLELLKILALLLIAISHSAPIYGNKNSIAYIDLNIASNELTMFVLVFFKCLGQIGNVIFIVCSAFFLVDSKNTKKEKTINIIIDSFIISIFFLIATIVAGIDLSYKEIIKQFIPIILGNNWFIGCYLLLYIFHPILNMIINNLEQRKLLRLNVILLSILRFTICI